MLPEEGTLHWTDDIPPFDTFRFLPSFPRRVEECLPLTATTKIPSNFARLLE